MRQPIQVVVYPVRHAGDGWEYLLLRRPPERGGFWQAASGGVEESETVAEAAQRELAEETGLAALRLEKIDFTYSFPVEERWRFLFAPGVEMIVEHVFVARVAGQAEPRLSTEHDGFKWCRLDEALSLLGESGRPEYATALRWCDEMVRTKGMDWAGSP